MAGASTLVINIEVDDRGVLFPDGKFDRLPGDRGRA